MQTPLDAHIADTTEARTVIVTSFDAAEEKANALEKQGVVILRVSKTDKGLNLDAALKGLYSFGITHLLVEGRRGQCFLFT